MINKQGLWFITLFSLIIILSIYYFTLPNDTLSVFDETNNISDTIEITQSDIIVAMKVEEEEKIMNQISDAQETLLNTSSSIEEKNNAFNLLQKLNLQKGKMATIEKAIKDEFNIDSCIKINDNIINVILESNDKGTEFANKVIQKVQSFYTEQMYITVEFQR